MKTLLFVSLLALSPSALAAAPADFCEGLCSPEQKVVWEQFEAGAPIADASLQQVFSGACYFLGRGYDPSQAQRGLAVFDRWGDKLVYGGEFSFFAEQDPYADLTLDDVRKKGMIKYGDDYVLRRHADDAEANLHPHGPPVWYYWFRQNAAGDQLYLLAQWDVDYRVYCGLHKHLIQRSPLEKLEALGLAP